MKIKLIETSNKSCNLLNETVEVSEFKLGQGALLELKAFGIVFKWWRTTLITTIFEDKDTIQISTYNSVYVFKKID